MKKYIKDKYAISKAVDLVITTAMKKGIIKEGDGEYIINLTNYNSSRNIRKRMYNVNINICAFRPLGFKTNLKVDKRVHTRIESYQLKTGEQNKDKSKSFLI